MDYNPRPSFSKSIKYIQCVYFLDLDFVSIYRLTRHLHVSTPVFFLNFLTKIVDLIFRYFEYTCIKVFFIYKTKYTAISIAGIDRLNFIV